MSDLPDKTTQELAKIRAEGYREGWARGYARATEESYPEFLAEEPAHITEFYRAQAAIQAKLDRN